MTITEFPTKRTNFATACEIIHDNYSANIQPHKVHASCNVFQSLRVCQFFPFLWLDSCCYPIQTILCVWFNIFMVYGDHSSTWSTKRFSNHVHPHHQITPTLHWDWPLVCHLEHSSLQSLHNGTPGSDASPKLDHESVRLQHVAFWST